jgi:hypothetical protein
MTPSTSLLCLVFCCGGLFLGGLLLGFSED